MVLITTKSSQLVSIYSFSLSEITLIEYQKAPSSDGAFFLFIQRSGQFSICCQNPLIHDEFQTMRLSTFFIHLLLHLLTNRDLTVTGHATYQKVAGTCLDDVIRHFCGRSL